VLLAASERTCGRFLAAALAADGIVLTPDDASVLTHTLLRLAELGALVAASTPDICPGRSREECRL
jgi:hypothetical protein